MIGCAMDGRVLFWPTVCLLLVLGMRPVVAQEFPYSEPLEFSELAEEEFDEIETDRDSFTPATTVTPAAAGRSSNWPTRSSTTATSPKRTAFPSCSSGMAQATGSSCGSAGTTKSAAQAARFLAMCPAILAMNRFSNGPHDALRREGVADGARRLASRERRDPARIHAHRRRRDRHASLGLLRLRLDPAQPLGLGLRLAVRHSSSEDDHFHIWAPSSVLKIPVGERWKVHAEYFGVFTEGREDESVQHFFSPGPHYLITSNLEIGVRVGWGLNREAPNFFSNVGLGWRY